MYDSGNVGTLGAKPLAAHGLDPPSTLIFMPFRGNRPEQRFKHRRMNGADIQTPIVRAKELDNESFQTIPYLILSIKLVRWPS